ncbi:hypothetical protein BD777DRAFT_129233 [Yarrowia lipolytica]|nr:hypothetical protein BD777DRAFT_129233 [Yarrowia lipolytica]
MITWSSPPTAPIVARTPAAYITPFQTQPRPRHESSSMVCLQQVPKIEPCGMEKSGYLTLPMRFSTITYKPRLH